MNNYWWYVIYAIILVIIILIIYFIYPKYGDWNKCPSECGSGYQTRSCSGWLCKSPTQIKACESRSCTPADYYIKYPLKTLSGFGNPILITDLGTCMNTAYKGSGGKPYSSFTYVPGTKKCYLNLDNTKGTDPSKFLNNIYSDYYHYTPV